MAVEPPFLYDRPSTYSFAAPTDRSFNPKAVTQASWSMPSPRQKKNGPLLDFNKHPDSYLTVPYGNLSVKSMPPGTEAKVKKLRNIQLCLRLCALLTTLGLLFCVISISKTSSQVGWIIRLAPAVALLHTIYAVYHLSRAATGRTSASTASYMLFAVMIDSGLVPFFVFSAMISHSDYTNNAYGWSTLFGTDQIAYNIIFSFFVLCVVEGSLLATSMILGIYLAAIFRKIAKLPTDMNPLEPILTARPHHKRRRSELASEKQSNGSKLKFSDTTHSEIAGTRRIPFMHTRNGSVDSVTLYGNESARNSKVALLEKEEKAYRKSQLSQDANGVSRPSSAISPTPNIRINATGLESNNLSSPVTAAQRNNKTSSWLSYNDYEGVPRAVSGVAAQLLNQEVPPPQPASPHPSARNTPDRKNPEKNWFERPAAQSHTKLSLESDGSAPKPKQSRELLSMKPPTPRILEYQNDNDRFDFADPATSPLRPSDSPSRPALREANANALSRPQSDSTTASFVGSGGKSRFYGNLRRSISSLSARDKQRIYQGDENVSDDESNYSRTKTMDSEYSHIQVLAVDEEDRIPEYDPYRHNEDRWNGQRQTSNSTGYDLNSGYAGLGAEFGRGMGRRREVSGKVAEEGRGYGGLGETEREVGVVTGQGQTGGAAGWARFKGM